jgi:predicted negative regulator of RcsB-dependent stress response
MDELEKKAEKGLESFSKKGDIKSVKANLDSLIDDLIGEDEEIPKTNSKVKNVKWVYIVILILGFALIGYMGYRDGSKVQNSVKAPVLYAQYFEVLPNMKAAEDRGVELKSELKSDADLAMEYYNNGDFKKAAIILKGQDDINYLVFGAIAEMKNNQHEEAIDILQKSRQLDSDERYRDIIDWYLALSYLKQGDINKSKEFLSSIANDKHYKKEEAGAILKLLK